MPPEPVRNHGQGDVRVPRGAAVDAHADRARRLALAHLVHGEADARRAPRRQARDAAVGGDVAVAQRTPATRTPNKRQHEGARPQRLQRQRQHDGPEVELLVVLEEPFYCERRIRGLLGRGGRGCTAEQRDDHSEGRAAHDSISRLNRAIG